LMTRFFFFWFLDFKMLSLVYITITRNNSIISNYLRCYGNWFQIWCRWILSGDHFGMNIAIQFVVDIEIAHVFQRRSTSGAFKALDVQTFIFDAYEHTAILKLNFYYLRNKIEYYNYQTQNVLVPCVLVC